MDLPVVEDFSVPSLGLTLRDQRNVSRDTQIVASGIYQEVLEGLIAEYASRSLEFCGNGQSEHEDALFKEAQQDDPDLKYDDFILAAGDAIVRDRSELDPRLGILSFVALERLNGEEIFGIFTLYNIRVESETPSLITINCMPVPGIKQVRNRTLESMWTDIMRSMLQFDMSTEDGREIDVIEWRFPDRGTQNWGGDEVLGNGFSANKVVDRVAVGHDLTKVGNVPLKVRRRATGPAGLNRQ